MDNDQFISVTRLNKKGSPDNPFGTLGTSRLAERSFFFNDQFDANELWLGGLYTDRAGYIYVAGREGKTWGTNSRPFILRIFGTEDPVTSEWTVDSTSPRLFLAPNPAASSTTVRLTLASPTEISLTVTDALGRLVHTRPPETLRAGENAFDLDTSPFAPGVYAVVVRAGEERFTSLLTVTR